MPASRTLLPAVLLAGLAAVALASCDGDKDGGSSDGDSSGGSATTTEYQTQGLGTDTVITWIETAETGRVAVRVVLPDTGRYDAGQSAPILVQANGFANNAPGDFCDLVDLASLGIVHVSCMWPGCTDLASGAASEGTFDYGGEDTLAAFRDAIRFALGEIASVDGYFIADLSPGRPTPLTSNVGLVGSSHQGIACVQVLARHGLDLSGVSYFLGWENPTQDAIVAVEIGGPDQSNPQIKTENPYYTVADYDPLDIRVDYSNLRWDGTLEVPYFEHASGDFYLGFGTRFFGIRHYSPALLEGLVNNGELDPGNWPPDLATIAQAAQNWQLRSSPGAFGALASTAPQLKAMLLFSVTDHVQAAPDKPHIHQSWDGFTQGAGLSWVRLNPDLAYVQAMYGVTLPPNVYESDANVPPADWADAWQLGYPSAGNARDLFLKASAAEMADRTQDGDWSADLPATLH